MLNVEKMKKERIRVNIRDMILDEFSNMPVHVFDSYKIYQKYDVYNKLFEDGLTEEQKLLCNQVSDIYSDYIAEREKEIIDYVFLIISSIIKND